MGTNYYRIPTEEEIKKKAERLQTAIANLDLSLDSISYGFSKEENDDSWNRINPWDEFVNGTHIHLGKRSSGWVFAWDHNDWKYYKTKEELFDFIRSGRIINEYREELSPDEFIEMATNWCLDGYTSDEYLEKELKAKNKWPLDESAYKDICVGGLRFLNSVNFS